MGNKGVTLIALIVTIIIMLILAGVAIATLGGSDGLFGRAREGAEKTKIAQGEETISIAIAAMQMDELGTVNLNFIESNINTYTEGKVLPIEIMTEGLKVRHENGYTYIIHENLQITQNKEENVTSIIADLSGYVSDTWTNQTVTQSFSVAENEADIQKYQYTIDDGATWTDCTNPWIIDQDCNWKISIRGITTDGTVGAILADPYTVKRDTELPSVTESAYTMQLYLDTNFSEGMNSTKLYNNTLNGNVTITRILLTDSPVGQFGLKIETKGQAEPGHGGFYFATQSKPNEVYVSKIIAKIPARI